MNSGAATYRGRVWLFGGHCGMPDWAGLFAINDAVVTAAGGGAAWDIGAYQYKKRRLDVTLNVFFIGHFTLM